MYVVWIINPLTREEFPVKIMDNLHEAFEYKEYLKAYNPGIIAFHTSGIHVNINQLRDEEEVIASVQS
jgi:hypothetical protein